MAQYRFEVDVDEGVWTCYNDSDQEIASGSTPLTRGDRLDAIFSDKGVSGPMAEAVLAVLKQDWEDVGV